MKKNENLYIRNIRMFDIKIDKYTIKQVMIQI